MWIRHNDACDRALPISRMKDRALRWSKDNENQEEKDPVSRRRRRKSSKTKRA